MLAALRTRGFFVVRGQGFKPDIRLLVLNHVLYDGCFILLLMLVGLLTEFGNVSVGFIILGWNFIRNLRLWLKIRQVDVIWPLMPSRGAPAP